MKRVHSIAIEKDPHVGTPAAERVRSASLDLQTQQWVEQGLLERRQNSAEMHLNSNSSSLGAKDNLTR